MANDHRAARRRLLPPIVLLCALAIGAPARAGELSEAQRADIDRAVETFLKRHKVPGLSAAIVADHAVCYEQGYGLADVENEVPATADTVYRLASISKMLTAVAVLQLAEAGELDLHAPIQQYVGGFPEKQAPLTCEHLLKHQGGIRHYRGNEVRSAVAYPHVRDSFAVFQDDPLLFAPGEKYSYTTYGYNVLGAAVEGASGEDYVDYVLARVAKPAGMKSLRPDRPATIIPHRAAGYRRVGGVLVNDFQVDVSNKVPGGGWCATPGDLARFAIALVRGRLLQGETLEKMWTPRETAGGEQTNAGYGCFIRAAEGARFISHSGGQPRVSTFLVFSPERKTAVAVMCNLRGAPLGRLAEQLMAIAGPGGGP